MAKARVAARNIQFKNLLHLLLLQYSLEYDKNSFDEKKFSEENLALIEKIRTLLKENGRDIKYSQIIQEFSECYKPFPRRYLAEWIKTQDEYENNVPVPSNIPIRSKGPLVYHYTTESVLKEFLRKDSFFCVTHWSFLNDSKELSFYLKKFNLKEKDPCKIPFYLMSFSSLRDDLNLWRAYAYNGGYALGFSLRELKTAFRDKVLFEECIYSHGDIVGEVSNKSASCFYKDPAFSSEKEVRLLFECSAKERIEIIGNKPRIRLNFTDNNSVLSLLKEIIIAPGGNVEYNYNMAKMLCHIYGITPRIAKSGLPFRNW